MDIAERFVAHIEFVEPVPDLLSFQVDQQVIAQGRHEAQVYDFSIAVEGAARDVLFLRLKPANQEAIHRFARGRWRELLSSGRAREGDRIFECADGYRMFDRGLA